MLDTKAPNPKPITAIPLRKERPTYSLITIQKLRDVLIDDIGFKYLESPFDDTLAMKYIIDMCDHLNWCPTHYDTMYQSIYPYIVAHQIFTKEVCDLVAYRFAGAYLQLHAGEVLPIPGSKVLDKWLAVEVISAQLSRRRGKTQLMMIKFNVTAGAIAGTKFSQEMPLSSLSKVFKESLKYPKYEALTVHDLFGTQFLAYLTLGQDDQTQFTKIATNSAQDVFNRNIRNARREDCINNLEFTCDNCPVGQDRCTRATHLLTYTAGECKNTRGEPHQGYIDLERKDGYCTRCAGLQAIGQLYKTGETTTRDGKQ